MRHECSQSDDIIYEWYWFYIYYRSMHDGRTFGSQNIKDNLLNLDMKTEFVKVTGGSNGGNWVLRVSGTANSDSPVSFIFYAGLDGDGELTNKDNRIVGNSMEHGDFSLAWKVKNDHDDVALRSLEIPRGRIWQIKPFVQKYIHDNAGRSKKSDPKEVFSAGRFAKPGESTNILLFQGFFSKKFQV